MLLAPFAATVIAFGRGPGSRSRRPGRDRARGDEDGARARRPVSRRRRERRGRGRRHRRGGPAAGDAPTRRRGPAGRRAEPEIDASNPAADLGWSASATSSGSTPRARTRSRDAASSGRRTARENLDDLLDAGTFVEYGPLMFAAQERRRDKEELIKRTPADGLVGGVGDIDGTPASAVLRLHRAGGHPGDAQPPEEGPPVRARRAPPAAGRAVRRGRRRTAGRRRHAEHRRPRLPRVSSVRAPERARAARRDRLGLLLRRQRRAARLLRRRDRDRGRSTRHGRPGDDRGRRARRVRAARMSARSTSRTPTASSTCASPTTPRPSPRPSATCRISRPARRRAAPAPAPDQAALRDLIPKNRKRVYEIRRVIEALFDPARCSSCAAASGRDRDRARPRRRPRDRRDRQRPDAPRRRDRRPRRRQGDALHAALRRVRAADRVPLRHARASWSAPTPSAPPPSATSAACS